jgi:hypothetical protein
MVLENDAYLFFNQTRTAATSADRSGQQQHATILAWLNDMAAKLWAA